ncbi:MAG: DUF5337 domain-containing protein [Paracoccaceae bacterium]
MGAEEENRLARKTRLVAIVIAFTTIGWLGAQVFGKQIGLAGRSALLFDMLALAGFFWALVEIFQVWRQRQQQ